jgi:uncharacterized coiled-coil DUF342 family protein
MKCDELKEYKAYEFGNSYVYHILEVNEAIAELKAKLRDHCISCPVKMQEDDVIAEKDKEISDLKEFVQDAEYFKNLAESYHKRWLNAKKELDAYKVNIAEKDKAIAELKAKLESVQASMYCDVVDANMENRRLKHSLYNLRACYADMMQKRYIECKTDGWVHRVDKWIEVERRCLKKAEEYK